MKNFYLSVLATLLFTSALTAQTSAFTFYHVSDLHVSTVTSAVNQCDLNGAEAACYLATFNRITPKPAFILATGDISNIGNSTAVPGGMYSALTQYLYPRGLTYPGIGSLFIDSAQTIPMYFAPGNHEYYTTLTGLSLSTQTIPYLDTIPNFVKNIAPDTDYAITTPISVILFMRSGCDISYLVSTDPKGTGLTDGQISFIRQQLAANPGKRKIIVMHHPAANLTGVNCDGSTHTALADSASATFYYNTLAFRNICDSMGVDVVLAGHSHQNVVVDRSGNQIDENCTTCGTRYVQTGPAFAGCYRAITVDSAFITVSQPLVSCGATAGISDLEDELNVSVYPNPSTGQFTLNLGKPVPVAMQVYNTLGQCVLTQSSTGQLIPLNLQQQPAGVYFIHMLMQNSAGQSYNFKTSVVIAR